MRYVCLVFSLFCVVSVVLSGPVQAQVSFFLPPTYDGVGTVFVADFNGDGKPDMLTGDGTMNLGNGDGSFKLGTPVPGAGFSNSAQIQAVADFNGDGRPDVLEQGTGTLLVLLGNGDGTFQSPISTPSGASLAAAAAKDLNGDGKADIVGVFGSNLVVYISKGDGTFAAGVQYNLGTTGGNLGNLLGFGDFNGDGKTDAVVTTEGIPFAIAGEEVVFLGNGDGTFQTTPKTSVSTYYPQFVAAGDFNGDGKLDLAVSAVTGFCNGTCINPGEVYVLLGNGDGTFQAPVASIPINGTLAAADVNGDGKLDLVLQNGASTAQIYLGNGDGTFSDASNYVLNMPGTIPFEVTETVIADFNLDGKLDIASGYSVQLGNGNGTFQGIPLGVVPALGSAYFSGIAIGDFDKNGSPDVAVSSSGEVNNTTVNDLLILSNDGTGKLSLLNTYTLQNSGFIAAGDFNGDGNLDLVVIGAGYSVFLGDGDGSFQSPVFYVQDANFGGIAVVADFNHDGKLDLAVQDGQSVAILLGNGDGTFAAPVLYFDGGGNLVTADFNDDGKLDLAAGATELLFGNGDGTFQVAVFPTALSNFAPAFTADLNHDGKPDLLSTTQIALGNGDGTFTLLPVLPNSPPNSIAAVADLNGDGQLDLLVYVSLGSRAFTNGMQLGNGDGTFGAATTIGSSFDYVASNLVADMNGDGRPDLVLSPPNVGSGSVSGMAVMLNTTAPGFALTATALSPATVTVGSSATSTVNVTSIFGFKGTVTLSCAVTPTATSAPTCSLSNSSVQISSAGVQTVTVTVGTTAPASAGPALHVKFPAGPTLLVYMLMLLGSTSLWMRSRKRRPVLAAPIVVLAFAFAVGCGGSSSSSTHTTSGTPAGTYKVTVTATSGTMSHNMALQVIVQ
jgi:hypothetical protein